MEIGIILFQQILVMFLLMAIGYFLYKRRFITNQGSKDMANVLLYAVTPCILINAYTLERTPERIRGLAVSFALAALGLLLSILVARFAFGSKHRIEHFGTAFSNAGFIGIPLTQAALGTEAVFYVSAFVSMLSILQWTYGVYTITGNRETIKPKKLLLNPVLLSMAASLLIFFLQIPVPEVFRTTLAYMSGLNAPIAMMILGVYLAQIELSTIFRIPKLYYASLLRLLLIPVLTILLFRLVPEQYHIAKTATLIAASAPIGANVAVFAQLNDLNYTHAVKAVCLCTIFCIVTMPPMMMFAEWFWRL